MSEPTIYGLLWFLICFGVGCYGVIYGDKKSAYRVSLSIGALALIYSSVAFFSFVMGCDNGMAWSDFFYLKDLPTSGTCMNRMAGSYGQASASALLIIIIFLFKK